MDQTSKKRVKRKLSLADESIISNEGQTSFTNTDNNINMSLNNKIVEIPERLKINVPTSFLNKEENNKIVNFKGLFAYIYTKEIFYKHFNELFKYYFSIKSQDNVKFENKENGVYYEVPGYDINISDLMYFNNAFENIRNIDKKIPKYFFTKESLMDCINRIYRSLEDLIIIGHQVIRKNKKEEKCVYEYTFFEKRNFNLLLNNLQSNNHLFEVIQEGIELKPFFDLEIEEVMSDQEKRIKLNLFIDFLREEIFSLYEIYLDHSDFVILNSNTEQKLSYHIIINNKVKFENISKHKEFILYLKSRFNHPLNANEVQLFETLKWVYKGKNDNNEVRDIFDSCVYTKFRCFRLVNQSKAGKTQTLILESNHTIKDTFIQFDEELENKMILETNKLSRYFNEEIKAKSIKENTPNTNNDNDNNERKSLRNIKNRRSGKNDQEDHFDNHMNFVIEEGITLQAFKNINDNDLMKIEPEYIRHLYVLPVQNNYNEWTKIGMALKTCGAPVSLWIEWSRLGKGFKEGVCEYKYDTFGEDGEIQYGPKTLRHLALRCKPDLFRGFLPVYNIMYNLNLNNVESINEDCDYLSQAGTRHENNIYSDKKIMIWDSNMGKGKTQCVKRLLERNRDKTCLFLSSRQTFAYFVAAEFGDFHNYLEENEYFLNNSRKIIISLESIYKIEDENRYDYIVVDECETIFSIFSSVTLGNRTYEIFLKFQNFLKKASKVIFMDAFVSNRTIDFCRELFGPQNMLYIKNKVVKKWIQANEISYDSNNSYHLILTKILEGKKIYMTFSSNKKLLEFKDYLVSKKDNNTVINDWFVEHILIYNKDTDEENMRKLRNINITWRSASIVLSSPKLTCGVSYNPEEPDFDFKYFYGTHTCSARDSVQSLMRVRKTKEEGCLYYAIGSSYYNGFEKNFLSIDSFNNFENNKSEKILQDLKERRDERTKSNGNNLKYDKCNDLTTIIDYLEKHQNIPLLRTVLFYNSLEMNISCRYYRDFCEELIVQSGFMIIKKEESTNGEEVKDEENEKIEFKELTIDQMIEKYNSIDVIDDLEKDKLEKKKQNGKSTREENDKINKYYYLKFIKQNTPIDRQSYIYFKIWNDSTKKRIILNKYYYNNYNFFELLQKEVTDVLCTEKIENKSNRINIIKEIEQTLEIDHNEINKLIPVDNIKKAYTYLKEKQSKINEVFKFRDRSKTIDNVEESKKLKYCVVFIDKIFRDFIGYSLKVNDVDLITKERLDYRFLSTDDMYDLSYVINKHEVDGEMMDDIEDNDNNYNNTKCFFE